MKSCFLGVDVLSFIIPLKMTISFIICISGIHWQVIMFNSRLYSFVFKNSTHFFIYHVDSQGRGGSRIFCRRGCTRPLLYFNTNKPHFFLQNTSCIRKPQVISWGGGAHPMHPPPRSAPAREIGWELFGPFILVLITFVFVNKTSIFTASSSRLLSHSESLHISVHFRPVTTQVHYSSGA